MKKFLMLIAAFAVLFTCSCSHITEETDEDASQAVFERDKNYYSALKGNNITINVYAWGEYIPVGNDDGVPDVNAEFTNLTGINVNYTTFSTNEEMYAKLKSGGASYDIIIPSDYMISRMIKENMLEPIDKSNIPKFKNIMEKFTDPDYDPGSVYSVPYSWGTVGILYDNTAFTEEEAENIGWETLWDEKYADNILMFDNPRDAFAIGELLLGYSLNTEDDEELENVAEKLKEQKKLVQAYVMDEIYDKMGAGEALLAPYYAGDAVTLMEEYDHLSFVIPESGTNLFVDAMCIPKGARHKEAAEMYINFMCEPDIAYAVADYIDYSTPNLAAYELIDDDVKNDGISYPDDEFLAEKAEVFENLSDETNLKIQNLWTELKSAEEYTPNIWIVPMFMAMCVIASIVILIRRYIKKKKEIF